jgi:hypothetical protein
MEKINRAKQSMCAACPCLKVMLGRGGQWLKKLLSNVLALEVRGSIDHRCGRMRRRGMEAESWIVPIGYFVHSVFYDYFSL